MKTYTKPLTIGLTLLSLTAAGPVLAEEGPAPGGFAAEHVGPWGANRKHFIEERLAQLHKELKLTSAQEADWKTWSDKVNQVRAAKKEARPDFETLMVSRQAASSGRAVKNGGTSGTDAGGFSWPLRSAWFCCRSSEN